ncbi:thymidylate synthase [Pantoea sp. 22096]|uniref:thymidylate synthase n=1 Tax=Pantoea sp. 22096 TaxID=3453873 RepID=UPI003F8415ED
MTFFAEADCIDDLLKEVHAAIIKDGSRIKASKGDTIEILGASLVLTDPVKRVSRTESRSKIISCMGEFLWYLTGDNKLSFIERYISIYKEFAEDDGTIRGGYGPRIFSMHNIHNQLENIITQLSHKKTSRRALVQLFDASDLALKLNDSKEYKDIPCTISLQFLIRDEKLNLFVNMRSNDAFKGLTHDIFAFTMIQEFIARILNCGLGQYYHYVSSMHLYEDDLPKVCALQREGFMSTASIMDEMPAINSLDLRFQILKVEESLRNDKFFNIDYSELNDYWKDLMRLIKINYLLRDDDSLQEAHDEIAKLKNDSFKIFFEGK